MRDPELRTEHGDHSFYRPRSADYLCDVDCDVFANVRFISPRSNAPRFTALNWMQPCAATRLGSTPLAETQYENVIRVHERLPAWAIHWPANGRIIAKDKMVETTGLRTLAHMVVDPISS